MEQAEAGSNGAGHKRINLHAGSCAIVSACLAIFKLKVVLIMQQKPKYIISIVFKYIDTIKYIIFLQIQYNR